MKKLLQAYTNLSRMERNGILAILILLGAFIGVKIIAGFRDGINAGVSTGVVSSVRIKYKTGKVKEDSIHASILKPSRFDPNTVDSLSLVNMGLETNTVHIFLNWRRTGKLFYAPKDFSKVYTLTKAEYGILEPYIDIAIPKINLNTADSFDLVQLPGIGARLAHRILIKRRELGKFTTMEEVLNVYHFPEKTVKMFNEYTYIK